MKTNRVLESVRADLIRRYSHELESSEINRIFDEIANRHLDSARLRAFVPVLVEREAKETLEAIVLNEPMRSVAPRKRVLFAHRGNAVMAYIAAALTKQFSGDKLAVTTARTHPENASDNDLAAAARHRGITLTEGGHGSHRVLESPEITVYLSEKETHDLGGRRVLVWPMPDTNGMSDAERAELIADLTSRVRGLVQLLGEDSTVPSFTY